MAMQRGQGGPNAAGRGGRRGLTGREQGSPKELFRKSRPQRSGNDAEPQLARLKGEDLVMALKEKFPKKIWKPSVLLVPNPVVLVSCGGGKSRLPQDVVTVAWAGIVNTEPAMISISLRPERFSHEIISKTREFVVNVPTARMAPAVDWCGMKSGRDVDKFSVAKLTALPATQVDCPVVADCPINIECKVAKIIKLGTHDLFLAKIVAVQVSEDILDKKGKLRVDRANVLGYAHGEYHELGRKLGTFGCSVKRR